MKLPPHRLPTLTEVLPPQGGGAAAAGVDPAALVEQVLAELRAQIDPTLDRRVQDAMAPALARVVERLVHETRLELARTLRDEVARAVAQALAGAAPR